MSEHEHACELCRSDERGALQDGGLEATLLRNREALLRFLRARGARDAAEDLLQELWLKAVSATPGPIADALSYLFRMANNLMLDRRRVAIRVARREKEWGEIVEVTSCGGADQASGEVILLAREEVREAARRLTALGERVATIFWLHRIEGVSQRQIGLYMGLSLSAVEKDLQKAYRAMISLRTERQCGNSSPHRLVVEASECRTRGEPSKSRRSVGSSDCAIPSFLPGKSSPSG